MCELQDKSLALESRLRDLNCHTIEIALAAARLVLEESLAESVSSDVEQCRMALTGAVVLAEAVVEQLSAKPELFATDGDVHVGPYSFSPGRACRELRDELTSAEYLALKQRDELLEPLMRAVLASVSGDFRSM